MHVSPAADTSDEIGGSVRDPSIMPLRLSKDETRAVAFLGFLLAASAGARLVKRPTPFEPDARAVDLSELERASKALRDGPPPLAPGERIDPNTALAEQLMRLPGASRAVVDRIVAERSNGAYRTADDLKRVAGIGPASVQKWRDRLALPAAPAGPAASAEAGRVARPDVENAVPGPLDLNRAGTAELEGLPGVGPVLARRIAAFRDSVGGFRAIEQLQEVRGVGPAMMRRLAPLIRIGS
jgi:competence ComEA-like helix-hairpin-helix protein